MKIFCCFIVFLSIISSSTSSSYDQFLEILKKKFLDEEVDVEIWNQINENAIQQMPKVTDYSNEKQAFQWLNWYSRVRRRYQQVRKTKIQLRTIPNNLFFLGFSSSQLEL